jgi:uncharacterized membrane protein
MAKSNAVEAGERYELKSRAIKQGMQVLVTLILLVAGLHVILFGKYDVDVQKWAYGAVGSVVGYWIK